MSLSFHTTTHTPFLVPVLPVLSLEPPARAASETTDTANVKESSLYRVIIQHVAQQRSLTISDPVTPDHLTVFLAHCLRHHMQRVLLLPWNLRQPSVRLVRKTMRAFAYSGMRPVSVSGMLPAVAMPDISAQGPLGSFLPAQPRLDRCVVQWPGWRQVYTLVSHEQASLLLLHPFMPQSPALQHPRHASVTERHWKQAVAACGEPAPAAGSSESQGETTLRRDGALFARYLTGIVCAAYDMLQTLSTGITGEAERV